MQTFVIRVWTPSDQQASADRFELRGIAEHVNSGEKTAFRGSRELLAFLESTLQTSTEDLVRTSPTAPPVAPTQP